MEVSVIIPNYNGINYIEKCLESVLLSDMDTEIIVVDNGSMDGSAELVERKYPQVKLIRFSENRGFCAAVNEGIRACATPYVFLLNNDAAVMPDTVLKLYRMLSENQGVFSCQALMIKMSDEKIVDSAGDYYCALGWAFSLGKDRLREDLERYTNRRRVFSACAGAAMYRRDILDKIGLFDENHFAYLEDVDIGYRARLYGYENYILKDAVVLHAGSGATGSRYNEFKVYHSSRNSIYLIYKNMPSGQVLLNFPLLTAGFLIKTLYFAKKGFGKTYLRGLTDGFRLCFTKSGRGHKIVFDKEKLGTYVRIEFLLLLNVIRRLAA
ncbi:MAG: glycosyltransferase family 2 protein [Lachnospiraceae bacterium]|nr:glycosyltransferase family 2 protein [Lachnospiraceae bacterium]